MPDLSHPASSLTDRRGRSISYLRLSVTDRCDFRCNYCMPADARFAAREAVMSFEENLRVVRAFVDLGVRKLRITGGEPLVRRDLTKLVRAIASLPEQLEVTMTTNGSQLAKHAAALREAGLARINVSLDTLDATRFREITRNGDLHAVLAGLDAARAAGFERIKLNVVAMKGCNDADILPLVDYAMHQGFNISFIEEMPFGDASRSRQASFMSSAEVRQRIEAVHALVPTVETTGGPARYYRIPGSETRVGFISPHTHNFCDSCNRVRVAATGELYPCLGNEGATPLLGLLRGDAYHPELLKQAILQAMAYKPDGHRFGGDHQLQPLRFMSRTGG
jgi:cyclic pyranopterin phosphate synthase